MRSSLDGSRFPLSVPKASHVAILSFVIRGVKLLAMRVCLADGGSGRRGAVLTRSDDAARPSRDAEYEAAALMNVCLGFTVLVKLRRPRVNVRCLRNSASWFSQAKKGPSWPSEVVP